MLVLSRRPTEQIIVRLGDQVLVVSVVEIEGNKVRLGFDADPSIEVNRKEVDDRKYRQQHENVA